MSDTLFQTMLDQALKFEDRSKNPGRQTLGLKRIHKRPLIVRVVPFEPEARPHIDDAALALVVVDPEDCPEPSYAVLQEVFGITKSEARVGNRLTCGVSLQEAAEVIGVTIGTVRSQTKSLFAKTGTNRQAELVRLLTRLSLISDERD
ncbi:helix-turn-helix transcriptional regulator [Microvirga sp. BT689]|uniref:helix-turn-helix transcriptional regulator n=1 Tax=Microvirga arvi TaxID=2778731 RepID=UPI001950F822|nr:helix-turn-helix transcriptional regulator [Microvirga arvi]MBM6583499.1 helix-turn-helix transcriptional regulator [Microvirga arvi]